MNTTAYRPPVPDVGAGHAAGAPQEPPGRQTEMHAIRRLHRRFSESQWWSPGRIATYQSRLLLDLLAHAGRHSPYYQSVLPTVSGIASGKRQWRLNELPLLSRSVLQEEYAALCTPSPLSHGTVQEGETTGATGRPVRFRRSGLCRRYWHAATLRDHLWHQRDMSRPLAVIRETEYLAPGKTERLSSWGIASDAFGTEGPMHLMDIATALPEQARWLRELNPEYLLSYPGNLVWLLELLREEGGVPSRLREIRTVSEIVGDDLRTIVDSLPGVRLTDLYSSRELGIIALQCPESGLYHMQAESLVVEILDEKGRQCRPGEVGRVVVTDLLNYATPLVRYEIGDYAEVGPGCPCGRNAPTLKRIMGRHQNMILLPDGRRRWPDLTTAQLRKIVSSLRQWRLVQRDPGRVTLQMQADVPPSPTEENQLALLIEERVGGRLEVSFERPVGGIERRAGGKHERVLCEIR
jgi:phenylacetate-CoA ligase